MTDSAAIERDSRSKRIGVGIVVIGVVIAVMGAMMILRLRSHRETSEFLVAPDFPLAPGDEVRLRRGAIGCATRVISVGSGGDVLVAGCAGGPETPVSRGALAIDSYVPTVSAPSVGDEIVSRVGDAWERARVVGIEPNHRIRVRAIAGGETSPTERTIETRSAFVVRHALTP